ncbi:hypothetical protein AVI51_10400 [Piscirickettsia salmonis]|uniref:Uncharacterized protein n=1 Tax=Piscirickettsia salmonis TaxID=1238 RepID=A0A9Q5V7D7_PISSA|nr:hypothetical protein [Piscirickettsia salmonis]WGZ72319.1 hypothetical protein E3220_12450 [Piscirickettsia salmonis EM-90]ALA23528.1 hypothetical protein KW89_57 [Piscirickettsia salmonis]APS43981.1 hypothetical protein AVI48_06120 [Piscirickettsia salmonis]APS47339.1 hypothetical protein AVI49_06725 [Piscirickettsia salmonis]APS51224.1 hypothetical protein AVI50_10505 [Piscirickettsia salmonis]
MTCDNITPLGYVFMPHHIALWRARGVEANYQGQLKMLRNIHAADSQHRNKQQCNQRKSNI